MGEYIQPGVATWALPSAADSSSVEGGAYSVALSPSVQELSADASQQLLALAWALLIYRGTVHSEDGGFTVESRASSAEGEPSLKCGGLISDVISSDSGSLAAALENIQAIHDQVGAAHASSFTLLTNAPPVNSAQWTYALEAQIREDRLYMRQKSQSAAASQPIGSILPDTFAEIFNLVATNLDQTVGQAIQLGNTELSQLWQWNSPVPPTIDICIQTIISEYAQRNPDRPAVTSWDGDLTYGDLEELSTKLAGKLMDLGVQVGKAVPLCFEKSMWTIVGVIAVVKIGGALVLMDPSQPEGRLKTIATEVGAEIIVTSEQQRELGSRIVPGHQVVVGPQMVEEFKNEHSNPQLPSVPPSSTLYIQFTSGSTGKPKGVVISHSNYTSGALPRAVAVGYGEHSRVLDFPSYAFDVSVDCMLCTLAKGGCICVPSEDSRVNDLSGAIRGMNVNMAHMTPSVARVLDSDIMPSLEVLGLGGESISAPDAAAWGQKTKIVIAYGPSECTVGCTINNDIPEGRPYTSIGKGVGGAMWVVDPADHNRLVPIGAVGELLVEGPIVGEGYLNDPEKTSTVFIENPYWMVTGCSSAPGRQGRLYKTGDLVRYDPDGSGGIVFIGRADQQVKLRGQRVELGEVEHHVRKNLPGGASVAAEVIYPGGEKGDATLVVFVSEQKSERTGTISEIIRFSKTFEKVLAGLEEVISTELPRYMIPTAYIPLNEMPLLVSLKTDRKQLHALGGSLTRQQLSKLKMSMVQKTPPTTDMERKLHGLWTQLFRDAEDIGVHDHFFSLGGDSLKAMKLVAAARTEGLAIRVSDIFQHPTLRDLALTVLIIQAEAPVEVPAFSILPHDWESGSAQLEAASLCGLDSSAIEDIYPCTPLQEALMALSAKVTDAYVAQRVVELPDINTLNGLRAAFQTVISDSAILRTRIVQVPRRGLMQVVVKDNMEWSERTNLDEYLVKDNEEEMGLGSALARFASIHNASTGKCNMVLTIHHALYDGWSMPRVVDRVNRAYRNEKADNPAPFKNFIKWLSDIDSASSELYWADQLQGATGVQFPTLPWAGYQTRADSLLEHYAKLPQGSSTSSTSIATSIRAAWALVAAQYTSSDDVVFGETLTGRNAPVAAVEEMEGPMITTVPVRVRIDNSSRASTYLQGIHNQIVDRISHEHMGLQHIRRLNADAREACELRTGIVIHPTVEEEQVSSVETHPANGFVPTSEAEAAREALKFNSYALMLVFTVDPSGFLVMASFDSNTVESAHMQKVLEEFDRLVQRILEDPSQRLGDIRSTLEQDLAEQGRLASAGASSLPVDEPYTGATAAWIVHPEDPEQLVAPGAIGELLVERSESTGSDISPVTTPGWLGRIPGDHAQLYSTNQLAKYRVDGTIAIVRAKDVQIKAKTRESSGNLAVTTDKQKRLQELWGYVLSVPAEGIFLDDNFFDLGGDSIRAMKLVSEARLEGLKLTVTTVFDHRQLFDMADHMEETQPSQIAAPAYAPFSTLDTPGVDTFVQNIRSSLAQSEWNITDIYPSRPLQEIAVKGTTQLPRYSVRYELFHFDTVADTSRLFQSCQELVDRNEILRTLFVEHENTSYAVVVDHLPCPVEQYLIDSDLEAFTQKFCEVDVCSQISLGTPFFKFIFVQHVTGKSSLILRLSHAQYDEICLPILLQQLSALYEERPVPAGLSFSSYVGHIVRSNLPESIEYWKDLLQGSSMSILQSSQPADPTQHFAITREVNIAARPKDITVATLPTAAWAILLARRLSLRDVTFGEVVSGRNLDLPSVDSVVGPCWQYVPVRVPFQDGWTAMDLLHFVQRQHLSSARFHGIGLKEIVKHCTDWPESTDWFDSVVHQDVEHVEDLSFMAASSHMQTIYPHFEPLKEIKLQAFPNGDTLGLEIVTVESWKEFAVGLLDEVVGIMEQLANWPQSLVL